jgi:two-component system response regulator
MKEKTILLVEDNPDDEMLTLRALKKNNILNKVIIARDGAQALELLFGKDDSGDKKLPNLPQVVLLDLNLPKINGLEVLKKIRSHKQTKLLPVVILTTSNEDRDRIESYKLGANSYVQKPVDFEQFSHAILQLGVYWLVINQGPPELDE